MKTFRETLVKLQRMNSYPTRIVAASLVLSSSACTAYSDESASADPQDVAVVQMEFKPSGLTTVLAGQTPQRIALAPTRLETIIKQPENLIAPRYGILPFGVSDEKDAASRPLHVLVDDQPDGPVLLIDFNRNGDMTDDVKPEWAKTVRDSGAGRQMTILSGSADLELAPGGKRGRISMYRFERDPRRPVESADHLFYYRDYFTQGKLTIGDRSFATVLVDDLTRGDFRGAKSPGSSGVRLFVDVNADNRFDLRTEGFDIARPFNIAGTSYEVAKLTPTGEQFNIVKSSRRVAELGKPIDHSLGKAITPFESVRMDGKTVRFPDDYAGKIVLVDFWATWCGPCMKEMPHLVRAYDSFHDKGLEILGVTLDSAKSTAAIEPVMSRNKMTWPQVNDLSIGELYQVASIPKAYLVDGSTGKIIATGDSLRGEILLTTIGKAIAERAASRN
jgi:thiol-disulfide isomerase/thioredoxin